MFRRKSSPHPSTSRAPETPAAILGAHPWPREVLAVLERLREGGHRAVLVGGTVRDALRDRRAGEIFDVATDLHPSEVMKRFPRVEPIGLAHGTVLILTEGASLECTTFRREGAYPDARHPESVEFTTDLAADLARRDLTVNAMAFDPESGAFDDPFGGRDDLARGLLRAVGDPVARFHEDALRPVRVARLAATLEMTPEAETRAAMAGARERAKQVAVERVRAEFDRLMMAPRPSVGWELLRESGLLELWIPELTRAYGVTQNRYHAWDVWDHSLKTCDAAPADKPRVRWAALLHDIGKVDTRAEERAGEATFYGHDRLGAEQVDALLERLRFSNADREAVVHLVREHMFGYREEWSDAAVRRWLRRVGLENVADLFDLRIADVIGNGTRSPLIAGLEALRERVERVVAEAEALQTRDLAVDGADVMRALRVPPGREVGRALAELLEAVLEDPRRNTREELLAMLEERARRTRVPDSTGS